MISDNARMLLPLGLTDYEFNAYMNHVYKILLTRDPEQSRFLAREVHARDAAAAFGKVVNHG